MAKRNKSRRQRFNRSTYRKKIANSRKRKRFTTHSVLSEPYEINVRNRRLINFIKSHKPKTKSLRNVDLSKSNYEQKPRNKVMKPKSSLQRLLSNHYQMQKEAMTIIKECTRRKKRREVIFAKKLNKKGSGSRRHKIRPESKIKC